MSTPIERPATVDVVGIGNALVDVLSLEDHSFVQAQGLTPGSMTLIDEDRAKELYELMNAGIEISGGSAANTMVGIASFGGRAQYLGKVHDDQLGQVFAHDLRSTGVIYDVPFTQTGPATGSCLVLVTPDGQRTMNTFLGASTQFAEADVDQHAIEHAKVLYLEGYLFDDEQSQHAFRVAAEYAHNAGRKVAVTLSDGFCVDRHRKAFLDLFEDHVDIVFANKDELCSLYETNDFDAAVESMSEERVIAAITRSELGSIIVNGNETVEVAAHKVDEVVDTTGAGDLYAAGFLYGFCSGLDFATCGELGSLAAAEVISHVGARPQTSLRELAAPILKR